MTTDRDFGRIAEAWLVEGPTQLADRVLAAALDEVHLTHQRRRPPVPWRFTLMPLSVRLVGAALIGVVILGVAVSSVVASQRDDRRADATGPPATADDPDDPGDGPPQAGVIAVDLATGEVIADVDTSFAPDVAHPSIAIGEGGVWARDPRILTHIDPSSNTVEAAIPLSGGAGNPGNIAIGSRTVWVGTSQSIERINPSDNEPLKPVRVSGESIAVGIGHVWTLGVAGIGDGSDKLVTRVEASADVATDGSDLTTGGGSVWVLDGLAGAVVPVDPVTMEAGTAIPVPGDARNIAFLDGRVWVLDANAGAVTSVDPISGRAGASVRVGEDPSEFATGLDALWVADQGGSLWRVDPLTDTSTSLEIGGPLAAVAIDERAEVAWVIVASLSLT